MISRRVPALALTALLIGCGEAEPAAGDCGVLELSRDRGLIEARFTVREADHWRIVLVHEGHVAWRGYENGAFTVRRRVKDYRGPDHLTVRAMGADGTVCAKTAVLK